ncbi:MAG TPA: hypothetical protein VFB29_01540 [Pseudolabrys sp.]|nr:hypothetical protein [Pseudolabrys sp.]
MKLSSVYVSTALAIALGATTPDGIAHGQGAAGSGTEVFPTIFTNDSVDPSADGARQFQNAAANATRQGDCVRARVTVVVPKGDPLFQPSLAAARRDALLQLLGDQARYFRFDLDTEGKANQNDVKMEYLTGPDHEPPRLSVTWTPPNGHRVKPGDKIKADARARDDANRWQTGVKEINFLVRPENRLFGFHQFDRQCEGEVRTNQTAQDYTVPDNPPPLIRLAVQAIDYAGNEVDQLAEFPTADWVGTLVWSMDVNIEPTQTSTGTHAKRSGRADLGLTQKRDGTVEGTLRGSQTSDNWWGYAGGTQFCRWRTEAPADVRAKLDGAYEQARGYPMFQASEVVATIREQLVESRKCMSPTVQSDVSQELKGMLPGLVHKLARSGDNRYVAKEDILTGGLEAHYVLTLRRAEN